MKAIRQAGCGQGWSWLLIAFAKGYLSFRFRTIEAFVRLTPNQGQRPPRLKSHVVFADFTYEVSQVLNVPFVSALFDRPRYLSFLMSFVGSPSLCDKLILDDTGGS